VRRQAPKETSAQPANTAREEREPQRPEPLDIRHHHQRDEWLVSRRYLSAESMALILAEPTDPEPAQTEQEVSSLTAA
jgi:hypothetical protein